MTLTIQMFLKELKPNMYPKIRTPPANEKIKNIFKNTSKKDCDAIENVLAAIISAKMVNDSPKKIISVTKIFEYNNSIIINYKLYIKILGLEGMQKE